MLVKIHLINVYCVLEYDCGMNIYLLVIAYYFIISFLVVSFLTSDVIFVCLFVGGDKTTLSLKDQLKKGLGLAPKTRKYKCGYNFKFFHSVVLFFALFPLCINHAFSASGKLPQSPNAVLRSVFS